MVSYPRYDPNDLDAEWKDLIADPDTAAAQPGASRASIRPGRSFKIIVAAAGLQTGTVHARHAVQRHRDRDVAGGYEVHNYGDKVYGEHDFAEAFASSINTTFAKVGRATWGPTRSRATPSAFGFGKRVPLERSAEPRASSPTRRAWTRPTWPRPPSARERCWPRPSRWRWSRPAVANGGKIMKPYMVARSSD